MIATQWFEVMEALDRRWSAIMHDGVNGAAGACMYFCSVMLVLGAFLV